MRTKSDPRDRPALSPRSMPGDPPIAIFATKREKLLAYFRRVRQASIEMCRPLGAEMFRVQPCEEVSPPWWNLGHTSWFFSRHVLAPFGGRREPQDADFDYLLNSYYASLGDRIARSRRGLVTRPTTDEIYAYRASVDRRVEDLLMSVDDDRWADFEFVLTVGINHEQQHQELFYTEIKTILAQNPPRLRVAYTNESLSQNRAASGGCHAWGGLPGRRETYDGLEGRPTSGPKSSDSPRPRPPLADASPATSGEAQFVEFTGGLLEFGHVGPTWCWDNELPRHAYHLYPFAMANRLVTNREYLAFMDDGGYRRQLLWLDNGWSATQVQGWQSPLYWEKIDGDWWNWTLGGWRRLALDEPVCHISFYEADAFSRWTSETYNQHQGTRLPSEREWEHAANVAREKAIAGDAFFESGKLHPSPAGGSQRLAQLFGVAWQWTANYYEPYPGYQPFRGALAEYNGKFMDNQRVLRGGSCVTPADHFRPTYRNFWPATTRFQFTGIRLARDLERQR